eukprot:CAMPEP_0206228914 /NCGR_PEP_ID=MMETSP0047_2-20121206/9418_1 /ASSEMBLY_ACC=CAM_ASM_000192 /TAXON_ID=195065 /ORGANISM="Chroomonas mesostigmatica_cf, Strain CCMP1168" /LENGTH=239 /DNA_ID=CAMNT_0053652179 /DNA_START=310 /DNA_END=1029 /DNA_ORIENTATION=-
MNNWYGMESMVRYGINGTVSTRTVVPIISDLDLGPVRGEGYHRPARRHRVDVLPVPLGLALAMVQAPRGLGRRLLLFRFVRGPERLQQGLVRLRLVLEHLLDARARAVPVLAVFRPRVEVAGKQRGDQGIGEIPFTDLPPQKPLDDVLERLPHPGLGRGRQGPNVEAAEPGPGIVPDTPLDDKRRDVHGRVCGRWFCWRLHGWLGLLGRPGCREEGNVTWMAPRGSRPLGLQAEGRTGP